jgi:polyhydroxybutyrate depolymerase
MRRLLLPLLAVGALVATQAADSFTQRPIIVYRPAALAQTVKVPLVLVLHGRNGAPEYEERETGFDTLADQYGFVVAYLKSADVGWDAIGRSPPDDLSYIGSEIALLTKAQNIDPSRVYVAGTSSGAFMAYRVACKLGGLVTAIADVSGGMATPDLSSCLPRRPVSVLSIHGDADRAVPIAGRALLAPLATTLARWRAIDHCGAQTGADQSGNVTTATWGPCTNKTNVTQIIIHGASHGWPGSTTGSPDLNATSTAWAFFAAHRSPKPPPLKKKH